MLPTSQCTAQLFTQPKFKTLNYRLFPSSCPRVPEGLWFLLASLALPAPGYPGRTHYLNLQIQIWTQPSGAGSRPGKGLLPHNFPYCFVNTRTKAPHKLQLLCNMSLSSGASALTGPFPVSLAPNSLCYGGEVLPRFYYILRIRFHFCHAPGHLLER